MKWFKYNKKYFPENSVVFDIQSEIVVRTAIGDFRIPYTHLDKAIKLVERWIKSSSQLVDLQDRNYYEGL